jgi:sec-independent protein translocase protein TatA
LLLPMETTLLFLGGVGFQEILVISTVLLVLFGAKKVPEFMKGLGKGVKEFKDGVKEVQKDIEQENTGGAKTES